MEITIWDGRSKNWYIKTQTSKKSTIIVHDYIFNDGTIVKSNIPVLFGRRMQSH